MAWGGGGKVAMEQERRQDSLGEALGSPALKAVGEVGAAQRADCPVLKGTVICSSSRADGSTRI